MRAYSSPSTWQRIIHPPRWIKLTSLIALALIAIIAAAVFARYMPQSAPAQPIPFSHRIHVQTKQLQCFFCHTSATRSSNAGIPPLQKCLLCHNVIASNFWPIRQVRAYGNANKPIPWVRVNKLPQHVRFSHQPHMTNRIDCSQCHGNVAAMDRVQGVHKFDMNFCVTCHWRNNLSTACFYCHY